MPWTLKDIKAMIVAGDTAAALESLSLLIGSPHFSIKDEFQWLYARYNGLQKLLQEETISEAHHLVEIEEINTRLLVLLNVMEEAPEKKLTVISSGETDEEITLTFVSSKKNIRHTFKTSPHRSVGSLKEALIRQFKIDTSTPPDCDNPQTYLVVNRVALTNDQLSLLEGGIKDKDMIQIDVQYHVRMIWNQSVPTRVRVTLVGRTFVRPKVVINNMLISKLVSLTSQELEIEFYTYSFSTTIKDLLFHFRFLDQGECIEFQELINARGKVIDLQKVSRATAGIPARRRSHK